MAAWSASGSPTEIILKSGSTPGWGGYLANATDYVNPSFARGELSVGRFNVFEPKGMHTPQLTFSTLVDGALEAKPVHLLIGGHVFCSLPVNQPSNLTQLPYGQSIELMVLGEGEKRTEVWGPYTLPTDAPCTLTGTPPAGTVSVAYDFSYSLLNYIPIAVWSYTGVLPTGLVFEDGRLYGTPTTPGTYKFTVSVVVGDGAVRYLNSSVTIT